MRRPLIGMIGCALIGYESVDSRIDRRPSGRPTGCSRVGTKRSNGPGPIDTADVIAARFMGRGASMATGSVSVGDADAQRTTLVQGGHLGKGLDRLPVRLDDLD